MRHATLVELERLAAGAAEPEVAHHVSDCDTCSGELDRVRANADMLLRLRPRAAPAPSARPDPSGPEPFEGYAIEGEIARGGQGIVYRATQVATSRPVAIKVLSDGVFASETRRGRFEREIELVSRLRHPNVVTVYDSGVTSDGRAYLVMEFVEGVPLHRHVEESSPTRRELTELCARVAAAIGYAHQRGVIHRDLKPSNVLVDREGQPRVLDFGLARASDASDAMRTRSNEFVGTLAFASPEQVAGDPDRVDVRTDVYSLGVLFYGLLTGRSPYGETTSVAELVKAITDGDPLETTGDADLDAILRRAMEKEREARYQTAGALAADLDNAVNGRVVEARRGSGGYVLRKFLWRHRVAAGLAFLAIIGVATATTVSLAGWRRAEDEAERARIGSTKAFEMYQFLVRMFASIDPRAERGSDVRVRELVDEAAERIDEAPPADPEVERELRVLIGRTYLVLGYEELARRHLERAIAVESDRTPPAHRCLTRIRLGTALVRLGAVDEAEIPLLAAEEFFPGGGEGQHYRLRQQAQLMAVAHARGDLEQAELHFRAAVDSYDRAFVYGGELADEATLGVANLYQRQAIELMDRRRFDEAAELIDSMERLPLEASDLMTSMILPTRARLLARSGGDLAAVASLFGEARDLAARVYGPDTHVALRYEVQHAFAYWRAHGSLSEALADRVDELSRTAPIEAEENLTVLWNELGLLQQGRGQPEIAETCYRRALECYEKLPGPYSRYVPGVRNNLSWVLHLQGQGDEAEKQGRHAFDDMIRVPSPTPDLVVRCASNLIWIYYQNGNVDEAMEVASRAREIAEAHLRPDDPRYAEAISNVGLVHLRRNELDDAERELRRAVAIFGASSESVALYARHRLGLALSRQPDAAEEARDVFVALADDYLDSVYDHRMNAARVLVGAAEINARLGRASAAIELYERVGELDDGGNEAIAAAAVTGRSRAASLERAAGRAARQEELLREAVAAARAVLSPGHANRQQVLREMAEMLEEAGREKEALDFREELHTCLVASLGADDERTRAARDDLLERCERLGETERAERLRPAH